MYRSGSVTLQSRFNYYSRITRIVRSEKFAICSVLIAAAADLWRFRTIGRSILTKDNQRELSAERLLLALKREAPNTEIASLGEVRDILRTLGFKFGNLHSSYYYDISKRADVVYHRSLFAPFLLSLKRSPRVWVVHGDASFTHENDCATRGWFSLDEEDDDLIPAGAGKGRRLNMYEFTRKTVFCGTPTVLVPFTLLLNFIHLILGNSAGTVYAANSTQTSDDMFTTFQRAIEAIKADPRSQRYWTVLVIDGAGVQKAMESDAIIPSDVRHIML